MTASRGGCVVAEAEQPATVRRAPVSEARRQAFVATLKGRAWAARELQIIARLETPAFLYGSHAANPKDTLPEFRLRSVLGILRFWWRAAAWGRALRACDGDRDRALDRVRSWQFAIWGSGGDGFGQGAVTWQLDAPATVKPDAPWWPGMTEAVGYLAGQGMKGRRPIPRDRLFTFIAKARPGWPKVGRKDSEKSDLRKLGLWEGWDPFALGVMQARCAQGHRPVAAPTVADALFLLHIFGGVGSRSRRGFGSLALDVKGLSFIDDDGKDLPIIDMEARQTGEAVQRILSAHHDIADPPPYSAFCRTTKVLLAGFRGVAKDDAHEKMGEAMLRFRGWGQANRHGHQVGKFFIDGSREKHSAVASHDHQNWYEPLRNAAFRVWSVRAKDPAVAPKRSGFGLPHNSFSFRQEGDIVQTEIEAIYAQFKLPPTAYDFAKKSFDIKFPSESSAIRRRASPFILKVRSGPQTTTAAWLFLHADFLPDAASRLPVSIKTTIEVKKKKHISDHKGMPWRKADVAKDSVESPVPTDAEVLELAQAFFADTLKFKRAGDICLLLEALDPEPSP